MARVYEVSDWMTVDERAERFRPLFNDEYTRDALVGLCIGTHPSHILTEYTMMQHSDKSQRLYSRIPHSILQGDDFTPTCGPICPGRTHLDPKIDRYTTSQGGFDAPTTPSVRASFVRTASIEISPPLRDLGQISRGGAGGGRALQTHAEALALRWYIESVLGLFGDPVMADKLSPNEAPGDSRGDGLCCLYFASDELTYCQGSVLTIDGGTTGRQ